MRANPFQPGAAGVLLYHPWLCQKYSLSESSSDYQTHVHRAGIPVDIYPNEWSAIISSQPNHPIRNPQCDNLTPGHRS